MNIALPKTFPVTCNNDFIGENSIFVAIHGYHDSGINYIHQAIEKGAKTIVIQNGTQLTHELRSYIKNNNVSVIEVANTRQALAKLSAQYAHFPAHTLKIIGITGTKGKTTTSFLLEHILATAGYKTALISTVHNKIIDTIFKAPLTTPQPDYLQQFLKTCVDHKVEYVIMEIAAQALTLHRVAGIPLSGIIFTNFSHEHLEFYPTLEEYFAAKCLIFNQKKDDAPILINNDDMWCKTIMAENKYLSYGLKESASTYAGTITTDPLHEINLRVDTKMNTQLFFNCPTLYGYYNAYNMLAALTMATELNISAEIIQKAFATFSGVPGRLQRYTLSNGAYAFIDYAHNPESFHAVLSTLRKLTSNLIVIFGAGGGRDKTKRPIMGTIAASYADTVIITSDNPRKENANDIAHDIIAGISSEHRHKVICELDRKKAIEYAYALSSAQSIIALLGKGPDEYQIIGTTKHYFSEHTILTELQ